MGLNISSFNLCYMYYPEAHVFSIDPALLKSKLPDWVCLSSPPLLGSSFSSESAFCQDLVFSTLWFMCPFIPETSSNFHCIFEGTLQMDPILAQNSFPLGKRTSLQDGINGHCWNVRAQYSFSWITTVIFQSISSCFWCFESLHLYHQEGTAHSHLHHYLSHFYKILRFIRKRRTEFSINYALINTSASPYFGLNIIFLSFQGIAVFLSLVSQRT